MKKEDSIYLHGAFCTSVHSTRCRMHVASIYVLIPVQNIAETIAGLYFALYSAAVFCTGMSTLSNLLPMNGEVPAISLEQMKEGAMAMVRGAP